MIKDNAMKKNYFTMNDITSSQLIILIDRDDGKKKQRLA